MSLTPVKKFARDERGGITTLILVLFIGIMLMTGLALDMAKHETQRASLQSALDRGVLAVTSIQGNAQEEDARSIIQTYVNYRPFAARQFEFVNPAPVDEGGDGAFETPWLSVTPNLSTINSRTVSAAASFPMDTTFLRMIGVPDLNVASASAAIQEVENVEISLVLDISGTMRWRAGDQSPEEGESRMEALKPAAIEFVNTVSNDGASDFVTINLVPYAGGVNIGQTAFSILTGRDTTDDPLVVTDLSLLPLVNLGIGHRTLDELDITGLNQEHFPEVDLEAILSSVGVNSMDEARPEQLAEEGLLVTLADAEKVDVNMYEIDWSDVRRDDVNMPFDLHHPFSFCLDIDPVDKNEYDNIPVPTKGAFTDQVGHFNFFGYDRFAHGNQIMEWGWCPSQETEMVYLSNDFDLIEDRIDNMFMNDGTSTYAAMKWAAAMLHPDSQWFVDQMADYGAIDARFSSVGADPRPAAVDDTNTAKYIVLMTDGNVNYDYRPDDPDDPGLWHDNKGAGSGKTYTRTQQSEGREMFLQMCANLRDSFENLRIFTIAFDTNSTSIADEMRSCASSESDFFQADTVDIAATFQTIAAKISELKLTN